MHIKWEGAQPEAPYFAVIFSLERSNHLEGYSEMDEATIQAVKHIDGYLGYQSVYDKDRGIFISYWKDESAIDRWRNTALHVRAKSNGSKWYKWYLVEIAKIEYQKEYQQ